MTEKKSPATAGTPPFDVWFFAKYRRRGHMIAILLVVAVFYLSTNTAAALSGITLNAYSLFTVASTVFVIAYAVVKLAREYKRETRQPAGTVAHAGGDGGGE